MVAGMKECKEFSVEVGFLRSPEIIFNEIESISGEMIREGWYLKDYAVEDSLGKIHLIFERDTVE